MNFLHFLPQCLSWLRRIAGLCLLLPFVGALMVHGQVTSQAVPAPEMPQRSPMTVIGGDYRLRPNDVVSVTVFGEAELNREDRLVSDGTIMMPLVGRVNVVGKTSVEAAEAIRRALAADYLVNPQVSVSIIEAFKETFTVLGQVASPGTHAIPAGGKVSLLQAVGSAGGFTRLASPGRITVKRLEGGREVVYKVDGKSQAKSDRVKTFEVRAGDVIIVPESIF